jgi:serine/threonine-protein kinase
VYKLRREDALRTLSHDGFKPKSETQASSSVKAGIVISTEPPAGTVVQLGSPITVLVSSGPAKVSVPGVTGESQQAAEAALSAASLKVGLITPQQTTSKPAGTVLSQSPEHGAMVLPASAVNLTVAQAPQEAAVPNVLGQEAAAAAAALEGAGFKAKTVTLPVSDTTKVGLVVEQNPHAGNKARRGSTVTLAIGVAEPQQTTSTTTTTPPPATPNPPATPAPGQ